MRETTVRCCRCRDAIESGASVLEPSAGPLRHRRGAAPVDLCGRCTADFLAWLSPALPTLEPTEAAESITVPA
jgi:hypothetical protein